MTVQGVDPDTLEVIVEETGGKSKARLWGRQRISPEINPVIYPDRGSLVRAETLPDMQPDAPADVDAPFAAAPTGVGEPVDLQKSLDEALAALGMPSGSVRIQNATAPRGAGLHSGARAGRFDVVLVDPVHVRRQLASGLDLQRAMEEEVLHNLDGAAMFHAWQEAGAKGTFRGWFDQQYRQVAEGMTAFERREAQRLYGDKFRDDVQMAMEYVRMLLQGRIGRGATESGYKRGTGSALDRVLRWLRDFYGNLTGKLAASRGVRERVKAVEQLDKASIDTAAKAEAVADTGAAAPEPEAKGPFYVFRGGEPFAMARSREVAEHLFWEIQNNKGGQVSLHGAKPDGSPGGRLPDPPQSAWLGDLTGAAAPGQDDFLTRLFNSGLAVPVKRGNEQRTTAPSGATGSPEQDVGMAVEGGSREGGVAAGDEAAPDAPAAEGTGQEGGSRSQREFEGLSKFVGDAGTGAPGGSGRGELLEPQTRTEVELTEAFQQKLWDRTYSYLHAQGRTLSAAQRDEAHTFIFSRLFNVARDFIGDGGTEARFGTARIIAQRFNNYLEWTNAQKREGGKETVALNAPAAGMEEGEGSTDEVIADQANPLSERNAVLRASFYRAIERLDRQDREIMDAWLDGLASGSRGWEVAMADRLGVSKARVTQLKAEAGAKFARAWSEETGGKEWERSEDERFLTSAAGPGLPLSPVGGRPRELSVPARLLRAVTPNRWGMVGYLQQAATTADTPAKGSALRGLANRVIEYFDRKADNTAQTTSFYYRWREKHDGKARVQALGEWSQWVRTAQARDAGVQPAAQWQAAEAYAQTVSPAAQELIAWTKKMGVDMGREMTRLGVQVQMPNGQWRSFQNLGEQEFPRRLSREVEDILRDPDAASNSPAYQQLLAEMVANDPKRFPDAQAADAWLKETAKSAATNGAFYAGAERARGTKLPDRFYDYTIDGFIQHLESWSGRMAQIHAFGQQRTAELPPAFERAQNSTADDALKSRLAEFWADISDHRIRSTAEKLLLGVLLPLASIRYLTSVMTSVRNLAGGLQNTAENLGYWRTLAAGTKGVADAAVAAGRTLRSASKGDFILHEPKLVQDGADAGTVQRSLYLASVFDQDPNSRLLGALGSTVLRPYQLIEQWNRGVNTAAAMAWLKDAQVRLQTQPASGWSMKAKAQLQRWGFKGGDLADLLAGNPETVRRFLRTAVGEKQYSYNATQTPLIFNSAWGRFLLQFQKWGAQRQRDLHRNVLLPALVGEQVDGRRVRDVMPLLRFIGGTFGQTALVAAFAALVFGRERKDQTWDEVYRAASEDEQAAVNLALGRIVRDITATGGAGILGDHARGFLDAVSRGRNKQLVNPPGLTLASDVMQLVRNQVERGGDAAAFGRDLWDTLVGPTPLPREVQDAALTSVLADTDAGRLKEARNDVGVVRALARRWLKETGAEDRSGGKQPKSPNSELYDQVNEALLIGDVTAAAALRDQFLHDPERKGNVPDKLAALKASVKRRAPLITGGQMGADDEQRFIEWARNRRPDVADRAERLRMRYRQAAQAAGVW